MAAPRQVIRNEHPAVPDEYHTPFCGANAVDPARMTPEERHAEVAAIMARGVLRRLARRAATRSRDVEKPS